MSRFEEALDTADRAEPTGMGALLANVPGLSDDVIGSERAG